MLLCEARTSPLRIKQKKVKLEDVSHRACYNVPSHCAAMRFPSSAIEIMQNGEQSCHDPDDLMIAVLDVNEV